MFQKPSTFTTIERNRSSDRALVDKNKKANEIVDRLSEIIPEVNLLTGEMAAMITQMKARNRQKL